MTKQVTVIVEGREYVVEVGDLSDSPIQATVNERTYQVQVPAQSTKPTSRAQAQSPAVKPTTTPTPAPVSAPAARGNAITSPMPGDILEVKVKPGDNVNPGDVVCVLEAMKMKNMIRSAQVGVIASVEVAAGQAVDFGAVLVTFE